jgi:ElaB/YqjD/DUF883 family membrane-anchored ribosome-binding protein
MRRILTEKDELTMRPYSPIALFVTVAVTFAFHPPSQAEVYKWQDAEGNQHFTDDLMTVPPSYRERVQVQDLPEPTANLTPAPPASDVASPAPAEPANAYAECQKKAEEARKRWSDQLTQAQDRLEELNRLIHRSAIARDVNAYQRERVEIKDRIDEAERMLRDTLPPMEQECESIRYWQGEE